MNNFSRLDPASSTLESQMMKRILQHKPGTYLYRTQDGVDDFVTEGGTFNVVERGIYIQDTLSGKKTILPPGTVFPTKMHILFESHEQILTFSLIDDSAVLTEENDIHLFAYFIMKHEDTNEQYIVAMSRFFSDGLAGGIVCGSDLGMMSFARESFELLCNSI